MFEKKKGFLPQTEEEFLNELTQGLPDDSSDRDDDDDDEDVRDDESEDSEEEGEQEKEKSQNVEKRSQNFHLTVERRADLSSMVKRLHQEGEVNFCFVFLLCGVNQTKTIQYE